MTENNCRIELNSINYSVHSKQHVCRETRLINIEFRPTGKEPSNDLGEVHIKI